jgi:hypothetical protein
MLTSDAVLRRVYYRLPFALRTQIRSLRDPRRSMLFRAAARRTRRAVAAGPFAGMRLPSSDQFFPHLFGTYEQELHPVVESLRRSAPDTLVNVGAAQGYYAVGLAMRLPNTRVVAFEADPDNRRALEAAARLNGVRERIDVRGWCGVAELRGALADGASRRLVIIDIEGGERELLDPSLIPGLARAELLVETHDELVPGCADAVRERFGRTHRISTINARPREAAEIPDVFTPVLRRLSPDERTRLVTERVSHAQVWLHLVPTSGSGSDAD